MISCCLFALTSCEIDNYESPNASIHGSIIDEKTGELVGMDVQDGGELKVVELGFANPQTQSWKIMNTGATIWFLPLPMTSVWRIITAMLSNKKAW